MAVRTRTATPLYSTLAVADKPAQQRVWIASAISIPNAADVLSGYVYTYTVDARPSSDEQTFLFPATDQFAGTDPIISEIYSVSLNFVGTTNCFNTSSIFI